MVELASQRMGLLLLSDTRRTLYMKGFSYYILTGVDKWESRGISVVVLAWVPTCRYVQIILRLRRSVLV